MHLRAAMKILAKEGSVKLRHFDSPSQPAWLEHQCAFEVVVSQAKTNTLVQPQPSWAGPGGGGEGGGGGITHGLPSGFQGNNSSESAAAALASAFGSPGYNISQPLACCQSHQLSQYAHFITLALKKKGIVLKVP